MEGRIQIVAHQGRAVMLIDFRDCSPQEISAIVSEAQARIAKQPRNSVLTLADFTGAQVDKAASTRIKEALVFDRPFVRRSAWIGTESLPKVFFEGFKLFSQRDFPVFKSREEALDWLVKD